MYPLTTAGTTLLMLLFAVGVLGCAVTIPICAIKFFAILFEREEDELQPAQPARGAQYRAAEAIVAEPSPEPSPPQPPRVNRAGAGR